MPFLLCNILIAFPLFFDLSSLTFCTTPWLLSFNNPLYAYIYAGCVCWIFSLFPSMGSFPKNDVLFSPKRRVVFIKTTCCFHQNDVLFSSNRRLVFPKTTGRFWGQWMRRKEKEQKRNVKIPITTLSHARTRTRTLQEFLYFCCHKCHAVIGKCLFLRVLWCSFGEF